MMRKAVKTITAVVRLAQKKRLTLLAAGITYYALVSLIPLFALSFILLNWVAGEQVATFILQRTGDLLTPTGITTVEDLLAATGGRESATLIGSLLLVWGAIKVFRGFDAAFETIYEYDRQRSFLAQLKDAILGLLTVGLATAVTASINVISALGQDIVLVNAVIQFISLTLIFVLLYYTFSDQKQLRQLLPGAVLAAGGWTILQILFQLYISYIHGSVYDVFGSILLLVTWLYIGNVLLLTGATTNRVLQE